MPAAAPTTAQPKEPTAVPASNGDATADFNAALNDPRRWVIKKAVPIFKPHQRTDPNTGKLIEVDVPKLYRIAENMQKMERQGGVPVRMTIGHTEPGKPETQQPPVAGYYRNARVGTFGPRGEPAIIVDEWLDPQYANQRKNLPYRSSEYYDDAEQITGVALLTRDPFLDLGVVAYSKECAPGRLPVHYAADGRRPVMYQFVIGDPKMPAPATPPATPPVNGGPAAAPPLPNPAPAATGQPTPYRSWPGPGYKKHNIGHSHPSGGAVYGRGARYATEVPPEMGGGGPGGPPPGGGGGGEGGSGKEEALAQVMQALEQAAQIIGSMLGMGPGGQAPQSPFPEEGGPAMNSRYGRRPSQPSQAPRYSRGPRYAYSRDGGEPQAPPPVPGTPDRTTVSGLPVGYQMRLDQLQYQNAQMAQAMKVLFYERDQADTEWCVSEIRRLASMGYQVGEYEVNELKKKPREERAAFLDHIATKYSRIGTDAPPPILGDPTPGPSAVPMGPASREEMEMALRMSADSTDPTAYSKALQEIRSGLRQQQQQYGPRGEWPDGSGAPIPPGGGFVDPYEQQGNY